MNQPKIEYKKDALKKILNDAGVKHYSHLKLAEKEKMVNHLHGEHKKETNS